MSLHLCPAIVPGVPVYDEDVELLRRIAERDTEALRALYERYGAIVHGMAYRTLGDRQLAEDCTQEVFVSVWRSARTVRRTPRAGDDVAVRDRPQCGDRRRQMA